MKPDYQIKNVKLYNCDNMEFMKQIPDNYYNLAVVDPPYGIEITKSGRLKRYNGSNHNWDDNVPNKEYFDELFRISKHQIIWGGNYFLEYLPSTKCYIIWDKMQPHELSFATSEFAWTNFKTTAKTFRKFPVGLDNGNRIHTTQKPVILYQWLLTNYAKDGDKIFDSHGGSFSSACACLDMGFDFDGCEIDKEYFDNAVNRLKNNVQDYFEFA